MVCPNCKNKGWQKTEETPYRTKVYYTAQFNTCIIRRRICMQCGFKFKTSETVDVIEVENE